MRAYRPFCPLSSGRRSPPLFHPSPCSVAARPLLTSHRNPSKNLEIIALHHPVRDCSGHFRASTFQPTLQSAGPFQSGPGLIQRTLSFCNHDAMKSALSFLGVALLQCQLCGQETPPVSPSAAKMIRFEVAVAEFAEAIDAEKPINLAEIERAGQAKSLIRVQLTSLDQQTATFQLTELVSRATGPFAAARRGNPADPFDRGAQRLSSINVGTILQMTPRLEPDGTVAAQVAINRTRLAAQQEQAAEAGIAAAPQGIEQIVSETTVRLKPGEAQRVAARENNLGDDAGKTWIIITAHIGPVPTARPAAK
jgi:hypothetical protein